MQLTMGYETSMEGRETPSSERIMGKNTSEQRQRILKDGCSLDQELIWTVLRHKESKHCYFTAPKASMKEDPMKHGEQCSTMAMNN